MSWSRLECEVNLSGLPSSGGVALTPPCGHKYVYVCKHTLILTRTYLEHKRTVKHTSFSLFVLSPAGRAAAARQLWGSGLASNMLRHTHKNLSPRTGFAAESGQIRENRTFSNLQSLNLCTSHILVFGCTIKIWSDRSKKYQKRFLVPKLLGITYVGTSIVSSAAVGICTHHRPPHLKAS